MMLTGVQYNTFKGWAKKAGITQGSKLSDEEFTSKLEAVAAEFKKQEVKAATTEAGTKRRQDAKNRRERKKFGPSEQEKADKLLSFKEFADPDEYREAIGAHFTRIEHEMSRATSPEAQINSLWAGILLAQAKNLVTDFPPVTTVADAERLFKMIRTTFGMDGKDGGGEKEGPDIRILTAKVEKNKVVEIGEGNKRKA